MAILKAVWVAAGAGWHAVAVTLTAFRTELTRFFFYFGPDSLICKVGALPPPTQTLNKCKAKNIFWPTTHPPLPQEIFEKKSSSFVSCELTDCLEAIRVNTVSLKWETEKRLPTWVSQSQGKEEIQEAGKGMEFIQLFEKDTRSWSS